jgi:signal transduction histidine kinase/ligand-binding sensor domain-containing protein
MAQSFSTPLRRINLRAALFLLCIGTSRLDAQLLPFHSYTTKDGLISNWVTAAIQDSYGYLWIGTNEGLSVYDGASFTNYTTLDGLSNNFITALVESKKHPGTIWIGTIQHGLSKYCNGRFTKVPVGSTPLTNNVISIDEDENGTLWLGTSAGVFRVEGDSSTAFPMGSTFANTVALASTPSGLIWMHAGAALLVCNSKGQRLASPHLPIERNEAIDWINTDRDGDIWVGTSRGQVMLFNDTTFMGVRRVSKRTSGILVDSWGFAWLNTSDGVLKIRKSEFPNGPIIHYGTGRGMPEAATWAVLEDREGTMWFQTGSKGLVKLTDVALQRFSSETYTGAAVLDTGGHVWATDKSGLWEVWRQDEEGWNSFLHNLTELSINQNSGSLTFDRHSRLCLVRPNGSIEFYSVTHKKNAPSAIQIQSKLGTRQGFLRGSILCLCIDNQNRMWCSVEGIGVLIMDLNPPCRRLSVLRFPGDLPISSVRAIFQDSNGDMWLGDYNGGLVLIPGSDWTKKRVRHFTMNDGLPDNGVRSFSEDGQRRVWVGTRYGGVGVYDGKGFHNLSIKDGLISNSIWDIARDSSNRMWLGTGSGLMFVNAGNLHEFGWTNELIGNGTDFCAATSDGLIWFGRSGTHLSAFDPGKRTQNRVPPPVYITHITVNDSAVSTTDQLEFPFDRNNCLIQFIGISFKDERNVQYQYRLNNANWSKPAKQRSVSLAALSPGEYAFEVRAINSDGIVSARPATLAFAIIPPLWQRWWFFALVVCLLAALMYSAYLYRVRQLLRVERLRTRIATDLHDDIGASLTRIALFSDIAKDEARASAPRLSDLADRIGNDARELLEAVSTLVWSIDPRHDQLEEVLTYMKEFAQEMFDMKGITYRFTAHPDLANLRLPVEVRRNLLLIFKESVNNVVRHSSCTEARVEMGLKNHELYFSIKDNGVGFSAEKRGHGLSNMRTRAEAAHGELTIASGAGEGTLVNLNVPVK